MIAPTILLDETREGIRHIIVAPCAIVCSTQIDIKVEGDTITSVQYTNGCSGNTQGVAALAKGMKVADAAQRLAGINCKGRGTSCPDQLAMALNYILQTA